MKSYRPMTPQKHLQLTLPPNMEMDIPSNQSKLITLEVL